MTYLFQRTDDTHGTDDEKMNQLSPLDPGPADFIDAPIVYTVDTGVKPVNQTMEDGNMARVFTGATESHQVKMFDGRAIADRFDLDRNGFVLCRHETKMRNFYDLDELKRVYYPEIEQLVKDKTGAARVVIFDHTLRHGDEVERTGRKLREPLYRAHNDYSEWSGPQRVRDILGEAEAERLLKKRFAIIQVWRPTGDPIERDPLAVCDAQTIEAVDLIPSERRFPDRVGETYQLAHNSRHRWYYFPRMTRDEAIVFKVFDSATDGRARFTAHTGFADPTTRPDAPPRESIEMRTFAFFD